jgi:hypothetical protein
LTRSTTIGASIVEHVAVASRDEVLFVNLANIAIGTSISRVHVAYTGVAAQMTQQSINTLSITRTTFTNLTQLGRAFSGHRGGNKAHYGEVWHGINRFAKIKTLDPSVLRVFLLKKGQKRTVLKDWVDSIGYVGNDFIGGVLGYNKRLR